TSAIRGISEAICSLRVLLPVTQYGHPNRLSCGGGITPSSGFSLYRCLAIWFAKSVLHSAEANRIGRLALPKFPGRQKQCSGKQNAHSGGPRVFGTRPHLIYRRLRVRGCFRRDRAAVDTGNTTR